jgi:hypothetical protein
MKKITLLFVSILLFATYSLQAQKSFSGEIQLQTKLEGTDDPNLLSSIDNTTVKVSILGNKAKTVQSSDMYAVTIIWDGDKESSIFLIEITGMGKFYKKTSTESYHDKMKLVDFSFSYEDEYKEVCGYKCQKVVITSTNLEDDSSTEIIAYVTKELGGTKLNGMQLPGLDGYPLILMNPMPEYCDACMMSMEAIKVTPKKIKDVDFLLPDDAKDIEESPEIKAMLGLED